METLICGIWFGSGMFANYAFRGLQTKIFKQDGHDGPVTLTWVSYHLENLT